MSRENEQRARGWLEQTGMIYPNRLRPKPWEARDLDSLTALLDSVREEGKTDAIMTIMHNPDMDSGSLAAMLRREGYEKGRDEARAASTTPPQGRK